MATVAGYERPTDLAAALELLGRSDAVPLGGGTTLNATATADPVVVVDLQALGLDDIEEIDDATLSIGATTTLERVARDVRVPMSIREAARRERPSTLRAQSTLGGTIASCRRDSELLATLLVHEARVALAARGSRSTVSLDELISRNGPDPRQLITAVELSASGVSAVFRTARTDADAPIVAAAARRPPTGSPLLALVGVAERPLLVTSLEEIDPPADFRGSAHYRRALAAVLAARALEEVS